MTKLERVDLGRSEPNKLYLSDNVSCTNVFSASNPAFIFCRNLQYRWFFIPNLSRLWRKQNLQIDRRKVWSVNRLIKYFKNEPIGLSVNECFVCNFQSVFLVLTLSQRQQKLKLFRNIIQIELDFYIWLGSQIVDKASCLLLFFSKIIFTKTVDFSGIQTHTVIVEGESADHCSDR